MRAKIWPISLILFICFAMGCGGKEQKQDDRFLGSWRFHKQHLSKKMVFRLDGTWTGEVIIQGQGRTDKKAEKKETVDGRWKFKDGTLQITPDKDGALGGWIADQMIAYEVTTITKANLGLRREDGTEENWGLIRSHKQEKGKAKLTVVPLRPIVVNVAGEAPEEKPKYLCVYIELAMDAGDEPQSAFMIHPRVQETAILYLSTLAHRDINTMDKIESIREALFKAVSPYLGGRLRGVTIKNIIITPDWSNAEEFVKKSLGEVEQKKNKKS